MFSSKIYKLLRNWSLQIYLFFFNKMKQKKQCLHLEQLCVFPQLLSRMSVISFCRSPSTVRKTEVSKKSIGITYMKYNWSSLLFLLSYTSSFLFVWGLFVFNCKIRCPAVFVPFMQGPSFWIVLRSVPTIMMMLPFIVYNLKTLISWVQISRYYCWPF